MWLVRITLKKKKSPRNRNEKEEFYPHAHWKNQYILLLFQEKSYLKREELGEGLRLDKSDKTITVMLLLRG